MFCFYFYFLFWVQQSYGWWEEAVFEPCCSLKAAESLSRGQQWEHSMVGVGGVLTEVMSPLVRQGFFCCLFVCFFAVTWMTGREVPVIFSTVLTSLWRDFQSEALLAADRDAAGPCALQSASYKSSGVHDDLFGLVDIQDQAVVFTPTHRMFHLHSVCQVAIILDNAQCCLQTANRMNIEFHFINVFWEEFYKEVKCCSIHYFCASSKVLRLLPSSGSLTNRPTYGNLKTIPVV